MNYIDTEFSRLTFNARLLLKELHSRGVSLQCLGKSLIIKASFQDHVELLYDVQTNLMPYPIGLIIDDKFYTKRLMQKLDFKVVAGQAYNYQHIDDALDFADMLGYPVVLKPTVGSHGEHVYVAIQSRTRLLECIKSSKAHVNGNGNFLIESYYRGNEYRLFVTKNNYFAAVARTPASVTGDGSSTIKQLVTNENYRRMNPRNTCLCEIKIDETVTTYLQENNRTLESVPGRNQRVFLRMNSNVSTGGNCHDVTKLVHPSIIELAHTIREKLSVPFIGIDLLCDSIADPLNDYAICELNSAPGLSLHMMPESGVPQNVASAVVDVLFPETKQ